MNERFKTDQYLAANPIVPIDSFYIVCNGVKYEQVQVDREAYCTYCDGRIEHSRDFCTKVNCRVYDNYFNWNRAIEGG